jgi:hypothetical protein
LFVYSPALFVYSPALFVYGSTLLVSHNHIISLNYDLND